MSDNIEEITKKLQEIADTCVSAIEHVEDGDYGYAITTLDETVEFGGNTLEKVQNILIKMEDEA